jgi:hypothetical protein
MPKVRIRKRPLINGRESVMLDYAPPLKNPKNGKPQRFEFLDLFIYTKPSNKLERHHNSETNLYIMEMLTTLFRAKLTTGLADF